jgi:hypothetical protein
VKADTAFGSCETFGVIPLALAEETEKGSPSQRKADADDEAIIMPSEPVHFTRGPRGPDAELPLGEALSMPTHLVTTLKFGVISKRSIRIGFGH